MHPNLTSLGRLAVLIATSGFSSAYTWKSVHIGGGGGYVPGIVFNPSQKGVAYARTDIGGLYRLNSDHSWTPLLDWVKNADGNLWGVLSVATDPTVPANVYAACGLYTNDWDPNPGSILQSSDYGSTWSRTKLPFKLGGNEAGRGCGERLAIDPNNNSILYLGAPNGNGLWKSIDSGITWSKVANFPSSGTFIAGGNIIGLVNVVFDTTAGTTGGNTSRIFIGVANIDSESVYVSNDAGRTWSAVLGQPVGRFPHRMKLSASERYLYLTLSDQAGPYDGGDGAVYRYNLDNGSWTNITPTWGASNGWTFGFGGLALDAQSPGTIMVTSDNLWWPDNQIFRSNDSGSTWTILWDSWDKSTKYYTYNTDLAPWIKNSHPANGVLELGWMMASLEIDPFDSNYWLYGTGMSIYGGTNLQDWPNIVIESLADGIEQELVYELIAVPGGPPLVSALGDIGGFIHEDLDTPPQKWFQNNRYSSTSGLDYAGQVPHNLVRVGSSGSDGYSQLSRSYDGGENWSPVTVASNATYGGKVAISADASSILWCTENEGTYAFIEGDQQVVSSVSSGTKIAADKIDGAYMYAAGGSAFYVSSDAGKTFTQTYTFLGSANHITVHPAQAGDIWLTASDGLYHSTDHGVTFSKLPGVTTAYDIALGKGSNGYPNLYSFVITKDINSALALSIDEGVTWTEIGDSAHGFHVSDGNVLGASMDVAGRVFVGTNGRGMFYGTPPSEGEPSPYSGSLQQCCS
ncbi:glycoside hydrolase family 74 protein [Bisporella sp. PMI_857]|nr:glycoside hydrolase family 74 protein [Bisporella sp. PMI_857]